MVDGDADSSKQEAGSEKEQIQVFEGDQSEDELGGLEQ